jgi:hypothetical protein
MMNVFEIGSYLEQSGDAAALAKKLRLRVESKEIYDQYDRFVRYSAVENEPENFYADVLHARFIARLEYVKFAPVGREFASTQYAFFKIDGANEERTEIVARFQLPNVAVVGTERIELYSATGIDLSTIMRVRTEVSMALLRHVIDNLERWSY